MTTSISFLHLASAGKKVSTGHIVHNIRKYYPTAPYFLASDAAENLMDIASKHNTYYVHYEEKLGYPGYDSNKILAWLERFHHAAENCGTTHIMMVEDDVWLRGPVCVHDDWEMAGFDVKVGNVIPEPVIDMIERFAGKRPLTNQYGCGGGAIFKVSTFLTNYTKVTNWFKNNTDFIRENFYTELGFMDCFMVVYYMLCGKDYSPNPYLADTHHHTNDGYDYDKFVNEQPPGIDIVNNYKKYYWTKDE